MMVILNYLPLPSEKSYNIGPRFQHLSWKVKILKNAICTPPSHSTSAVEMSSLGTFNLRI
jgi:hypothetical protein